MLHSANSKNSSAAEIEMNTHTHTHRIKRGRSFLFLGYDNIPIFITRQNARRSPKTSPSSSTSPPKRHLPQNPKTHTHKPLPSSPAHSGQQLLQKENLYSSKKIWRTTIFAIMSSRESYCKNPIAATAARLDELRAATMRSNNSRAGFQLLLNPNPKWSAQATEKLRQRKHNKKKVTKICEFF